MAQKGVDLKERPSSLILCRKRHLQQHNIFGVVLTKTLNFTFVFCFYYIVFNVAIVSFVYRPLQRDVLCRELQNDVLECYRNNKHHPLRCSNIVKEFRQCVQDARRVSAYYSGLILSFLIPKPPCFLLLVSLQLSKL